MRRVTMSVALAVVAILTGAAVQAQSPWLHVRVNGGDNQESVALNLPLSVVQAVLRAAPEHLVEDGRIRIRGNDSGLRIADLRTIWVELSAAGDADFVTMQDDDKTIRVGRRGDQIQVRVADPDDGEELTIDVPARLVDALLSGDGDELNIEAAVDVLQGIRGDVVNIRGDDDRVRVWVDDAAS